MLIQKNISLRDKNTYRIGGSTAFYSEPRNEDEILSSLKWASEKKLPVFILGKGSNVLISDSGWPGIVINVAESFKEILWDENLAVAQSGAMLNTLVNQSIEHSFAGMEELCGIPGTVGGAVVMNAGAFSMCVEGTIEWVRYFDLIENKIIVRTKNEMDFGYRKSYLKDRPAIIITAAFRFTKSRPVDDLIATRSEIQSKRKIKQPLEYPNCGSVFKRPVNNFAGTLIENCGLKGKRIGDAEVSDKHANFIVNRGNCTAEDVRNLIILIQKNVYECSGILLEPEVIFIGSFTSSLFIPD